MLQYFKQAWNLIKQEKLFSSIYILGTGLSITVVMVLSIVFYVRVANIYPETNRDRTLVVKSGSEENKNGGKNSAPLSYNTVETCFSSLQDVEAVSAIYKSWGKEHYVQPSGSKEQIPIAVKYVDTGFWNVFSFRFLQGTPFSEADFQSGIHTAVISASVSKRLFGTTDAVGQYVSLNFMPYKVRGVVKDASFVTETTYAQIYIPYTVTADYKNSFSPEGSLGNFSVYLLASSTDKLNSIRTEAIENIRKLNTTLSNAEFTVNGQPDRYWQSTFRLWSSSAPDFTKIFWQHCLLFLILLLVPGISLSGMTDSRMERRLAEMGIRRVFGAPRNILMRQIFSENFLFTLIGGLVGLLFSYLLILVSADWIMGLGQNFIQMPPEGEKVAFTPAMLINIPVFLITLGACFLLNLIAAIIPAWRASHREIILSLNDNKA